MMNADEIIAGAAMLAGLKEAPPEAPLLWRLCRQDILNYTNRAELPEELEPVGMQILADVLKNGAGATAGVVQSISEGDTSMTFAQIPAGVAAWERYKPQLNQFRRFCRK